VRRPEVRALNICTYGIPDSGDSRDYIGDIPLCLYWKVIIVASILNLEHRQSGIGEIANWRDQASLSYRFILPTLRSTCDTQGYYDSRWIMQPKQTSPSETTANIPQVPTRDRSSLTRIPTRERSLQGEQLLPAQE
jgi:hypothetical protein